MGVIKSTIPEGQGREEGGGAIGSSLVPKWEEKRGPEKKRKEVKGHSDIFKGYEKTQKKDGGGGEKDIYQEKGRVPCRGYFRAGEKGGRATRTLPEERLGEQKLVTRRGGRGRQEGGVSYGKKMRKGRPRERRSGYGGKKGHRVLAKFAFK